MDPLKLALILSIVALGVVIISSFLLAFVYNRSSRNLALATGTLGGGAVLFCTQLYFELQPSSNFDFVTTQFTIDRAKLEIRQWIYSEASGRIAVEPNASQWLLTKNPDAFQKDREKLATDLLLFSLVSFLQSPEAQLWETQRHAIGSVVRFHSYPGRACQLVTEGDIQSELSRSGNAFAGAPLFGNHIICFPPGSTLRMSGQSLVIRNLNCQIAFRIEPSRGVNYLNPGRGEELPKLPNGQSRFETRFVGLDIETTFFGLRAQSRESTKYHEWASAVVNGVRDWFEK